jgi:hypothetical protein
MDSVKIFIFMLFFLYSYSIVKVILRDDGVRDTEYYFLKVYLIIFTILMNLGLLLL